MFTKSNITLSLALALAMSSAAIAASKHAVRHPAATLRHIPAKAYLSFAALRDAGRGAKPTYFSIQDIGYRESVGE